ncbi:MAG: hypothetical protein ACRETX_12990, partial [Steroidobacteraceae bacterium]
TPSGYQPESDEQDLMKRLFEGETGVQAVPVGQQIDLFIPGEIAAHHGIGEYVVVIASREGQPVGIGELSNFSAQPAEITRYQVALQPYPRDQIERWGRDEDGAAANDCFRWSRPRANNGGALSIAIVRDNDADCDAYPDAHVDCDSHAYCDGAGGPGCTGDDAPCPNTTFCALGRCVNAPAGEAVERSCEPTVCLMEAACTKCDESSSTEEYLKCSAHLDTHLEVEINLRSDQSLCRQPLQFKVPVANGACVEPVIEWARANDFLPSPFMFEVAQDAEAPGACLFTLSGPIDESFDPHHMLVSVTSISANPVAPKRSLFTLAVEVGNVTDACPLPLYTIATEPQVTIGSCLDIR